MQTIIQGERKVLVINCRTKDEDGVVRPYDFTGWTEIKVCLAHASVLEKTTPTDVTVLGSDDDGKLQVILSNTDTDGMTPINAGSVEIVETKGAGEVTKFQIANAFQVVEKICP